jgi:uncharacterized protein (UPF0335 family)
MYEGSEPNNSPAPKANLAEIFDLDRKKITRQMVDRFEQCMRDADQVKADMSELTNECREAQFGPKEIAAMKKIAKLRKEDKRGNAQEQLAALERVSDAIGFDLFSWRD